MGRRKKPHRWGQDPMADAAQLSAVDSRGIGRLGSIVRQTVERRNLPENIKNLVAAVDAFRPARAYHREVNYHMELTGWLKARLGESVTIEEQRGRSRPDIVVGGNIAVEIKGPTTNQGLATISDKVVRYRRYFQTTIVVLFDVQDEQRYAEWLAGTKRQFPEVQIIKKEPSTVMRWP